MTHLRALAVLAALLATAAPGVAGVQFAAGETGPLRPGGANGRAEL